MKEPSKQTTWADVENRFHETINAVVEADRLVKGLQHDVAATLAKGRRLAAQSGQTAPMGFTEWRDHGIKYGYWAHLDEGAHMQEPKRILALMSKPVYTGTPDNRDQVRALLVRKPREMTLAAATQSAPVSQQFIEGYNAALEDVIKLIEQE
jgi:hypothetical protein